MLPMRQSPMCITRLYPALSSIALLVAAAGCALVATVTPGPGSIATPAPTVAATDSPPATATVAATDVPTVTATLAATDAPPATATLAATDVPTITVAVQQAIAECTAEAAQGDQEAYAGIADLLVEIWLVDAQLCTVVAKQPWILGQEQGDGSNGTLEERRLVLESLHRLASADIELANLAVNVPWLVDGLSHVEARILEELSNLAIRDANLGRTIAEYPWFNDGSFHPPALTSALLQLVQHRLMSTDVELARTVADVWLASGVPTFLPIGTISNLASGDIGFELQMAGLSWLKDGVTDQEKLYIRNLQDLASADFDFARQVAGLPGFTDGIAGHGNESFAIHRLASLATLDIGLARQMAALPWFADGITVDEGVALRGFFGLASEDIEEAELIAASSWFTDGITREEAENIGQ